LYRERDDEKRRIFLKALREIPTNERIYLDESGINKYLCREYGRNTRGKKVLGEVSGHHYIRESVIAAISRGKFLSPMCFRGTCDTNLFNVWLEQVLIPELKPGQTLILDNASFHKSAESRKLVEKAGCKLMFLPPYSPDLNPIEKYWANMKTKVRELLPKVQNLAGAMDEAILSM
jgi:transposase